MHQKTDVFQHILTIIDFLLQFRPYQTACFHRSGNARHIASISFGAHRFLNQVSTHEAAQRATNEAAYISSDSQVG